MPSSAASLTEERELSAVRGELVPLYAPVERGDLAGGVILGRPHTGKSRLLAEAGQVVRSRGWLFLSARGTPELSEVPRGLVLRALTPLFPQGLPPGVAAQAPQARQGELPLALASLLPESPRMLTPTPPAPAPRWEAGPPVPAGEIDAYLLREIHAASRRSPILLALDDVHWVDEASLKFLQNLLRPEGPRRLLVLLALDRDRESRLPPRLLEGPTGVNHWRRWVLRPGGLGAPPVTAPAAPLDSHGDLQREALLAAAVLGMEFSPTLLREVTGLPEAKVQALLEEAATRGWIWPEGESYHFSGESTWRWARGEDADSQRRWHAAAAQALERSNPQPAGRVLFDLARHWEAAGDGARAFPYLEASATTALRSGAFESARDRYERARTLLPTLAPKEQGPAEVRLLRDLAGAEEVMGAQGRAEEHLLLALRQAAKVGLPPGEQSRLEVRLAGILQRAGRYSEAIGVLDRARLRAVEAKEVAAEAMVHARRATVLSRESRFTEAEAAVEEAARLLPADASAEERGILHEAQADVWVFGGEGSRRKALAAIEAGRRDWQEAGQPHRELALLNLEGLSAFWHGNDAVALRAWHEAGDMALRMGYLGLAIVARGNEAEGLAELGRLDEARTALEDARRQMPLLDQPPAESQVRIAAAVLAWKEGDLPTAEKEIDRGLRVGAVIQSAVLREQFIFLRARIRWSSGKEEAARTLLSSLAKDRYPGNLSPRHRVEWERMMPDAPAVQATK